MGDRLPDREWRVAEFLLRAATLGPDLRFALGGEGWDDRALPANVQRLGHVPPGRRGFMNANARFVLEIHREPMVENGWFPSTHLFEGAGNAACQVTDASRGLEEFFVPGREILVAHSADEVVFYARTVDDARARAIGQAARARALGQHTYAHRADDVEAVLGVRVQPNTPWPSGARARTTREGAF